MELETVLTVAGLLVTVVAMLVGGALAYAPQRLASRERSVALFIRTRQHLRLRRPELTTACLGVHAEHRADTELPLLTRPGWIPPRPLPLDAVRLTLREARSDERAPRAHATLRRYWPHSGTAGRLTAYSAAIEAYDRPAVWFNGPSYRLLEVATRPAGTLEAGLDLTLSLSRYFDGLDTGEALAYEAALRDLRGRGRGGGRPSAGPYRRGLGGPFALGARAALPGVSTLTIRVEDGRPYFFLHRREAGRVAVATGITHVVPAGELQPHTDTLPVWRSDLDLWRNTMREYAEEFLGAADATGDGGVTIDYERDRPYADMQRAMREGRARVRFLGLGLDPLPWKPEICLVCVWDADAFDEIFAGMGERNEEGVLVVGTRTGAHYQGIPFTEENVLGYANHLGTLAAGRTCLALAWRWRHELGLG
ncbi:hypothetical protein PV379_44720 [Streptomyces caniscabiei]|uniref:hypothetical protein n=1 Tax=Streptomyces TaxID=1883 RepID=UPI0029BC077B|nr:hypothetical protein [Streptomyces caniscabiei]MDX2606143.1 hypothetical protein [Streptomyces caniscabiei]MDX2741861.1 hypothetical protein [Streptomyces caniscabiei]MDX2784365.1 hypothetical protein [Streptomyces caniscabiei]